MRYLMIAINNFGKAMSD